MRDTPPGVLSIMRKHREDVIYFSLGRTVFIAGDRTDALNNVRALP